MGCGSSSPSSNHHTCIEDNRHYEEEKALYEDEEALCKADEAIRLEGETRIRESGEEKEWMIEEESRRIEEDARRRVEDEKKKAEDAMISVEDETPFDDDGFRDAEGYSKTTMSLMVKSMDYRKQHLDADSAKRPLVSFGTKYTDEDFPLEMAIVQDYSNLEWKRPGEFVDAPRLFTDGTTRFDIGQGSAGTCWFLSTVANIAENEDMLKQVIPDGAYTIENPDEYDGVFHARFFHFGQWEDVYIDDFLPVVIHSNALWGAKSAKDENEMWVALLEKAFAHLYGSYDAIYGGMPGDAYLLLTGGIGERIDLEEHADKPNKLFKRVTNAINSGCQVACSVPDEYNNQQGLVGGHAYSLTETTQVGETKLIRVRNPWGNGEWKGPWSDGSKEWNSVEDSSVVPPKKDDGEFYMSLHDFMTYFSGTTICSLTPDMDLDGKADLMNHILSIYGEWKAGCAGGFHKLLDNPRYCFTVTEEGAWSNGYISLVIQIIQRSEKRKTDNISMRCDIFKVLGEKIRPSSRRMTLEIQGTKNNVYSPELQVVFRHWLMPGKYMVIPSTLDEGLEKAFLIRLFSFSPLLNVNEISQDSRIVSCGNETIMKHKEQQYELTLEKTLFGEFKAGSNAGGQVSHKKSYDQNPQYLIDVPSTGSPAALVIHIMQGYAEPQYPVGIRLFRLNKDTSAPVNIDYLYDNYVDSPASTNGAQSMFMISWDVDISYLLPAGRYIALIHLDEPDTEKEFSVVFKSNAHVRIKGYQTS